MIRLFCGYDEREALGFHVFAHSVIARASKPVSIIPLASMGLPQGSNSFTMSRFLLPYLCGFQGHAIFMDASDMLMLCDVAELDSLFDPQYAVQVVQHPNYETRNPRKYIGTPMECVNTDYRRKNWASVMLVNAEHGVWALDTPARVAMDRPIESLQFQTLHPSDIGGLPPAWNVLIDEGQPTDGAKVLHWTAGLPAFEHYGDAPGADIWRNELVAMQAALHHG